MESGRHERNPVSERSCSLKIPCENVKDSLYEVVRVKVERLNATIKSVTSDPSSVFYGLNVLVFSLHNARRNTQSIPPAPKPTPTVKNAHRHAFGGITKCSTVYKQRPVPLCPSLVECRCIHSRPVCAPVHIPPP